VPGRKRGGKLQQKRGRRTSQMISGSGRESLWCYIELIHRGRVSPRSKWADATALRSLSGGGNAHPLEKKKERKPCHRLSEGGRKKRVGPMCGFHLTTSSEMPRLPSRDEKTGLVRTASLNFVALEGKRGGGLGTMKVSSAGLRPARGAINQKGKKGLFCVLNTHDDRQECEPLWGKEEVPGSPRTRVDD